MLRLRLASIPIEVHFSHLALSLVLAFIFAQPPRSGWAETAPTPLVVALLTAIFSGTALIHVMGQALTSRVFGYRPLVQLIGMGGRTLPNPNETMPWYREVLLVVAGPLTGLGVCIGAGMLMAALNLSGKAEPALDYALKGIFWANLFWSLYNLIPIHPLDGGRIATAIMMRVFGRDGFLYAQVLGLCVGVSIAAVAFAKQQPFIGVFAVLYLSQTAVLISAFRKGELPRNAPHPLEQAAAHAEALFGEDKLVEARGTAEPLLALELQPALRSRVHLLMGWVAVKLGEGRRALDHFSQVFGLTVPPEALAAAFSLVGDDARAAGLWEQAARRTSDVTLLHEWAGTLIRLGRDAEALKLPGLHGPAAYQCAQRVFFHRAEFAGAARCAEARFELQPSANRAYDAACCWAKASRPDDAVRLLALAAQHGFVDVERAATDDELSSLRSHAGFHAFVAGLRAGPRN